MQEALPRSIGFGLVVYVFSVFALGTGLLAIQVAPGPIVVLTSLCAAALAATFIAKQDGCRPMPCIAAGALTLLLVLVSIAASGLIYDSTWDGISYHQEAVNRIADGWNPLYEHLREQIDGPVWQNEPALGPDAYNVFLNHYAKFNWIFGASHYLTFDSIEVGKAYTLILAAAAGLLVFATLRSALRVSLPWSAVIAASAVANPVLLTQMFSYYTDALVYLGFLLTSVAIVQAVVEPRLRWSVLTVMCAALLVNAKFTGAVYCVLISACAVAYAFFFKGFGTSLKLAGVLALAFAIAIAVLGFDPYVQNLMEHGHPFWPLYGPGAIDIMANEFPRGLQDMNPVSRFLASLFSTVGAAGPGGGVNIRLPFVLDSLAEIEHSRYYDTRLSGFGFFFSGAVVLCVGALAWLAAKRMPGSPRAPAWFLVLALLATVFVNPQSWWARYVPQLWLLPVITVLLLCLVQARTARLLGIGIAAVLLVNSTVITGVVLATSYQETGSVRRDLYWMQQAAQPVPIYFGQLAGTRSRLEDRGIAFRPVDTAAELPCADAHTFFATWHEVRYCR